jgi:diguanylate cyclase (GGDEF)-like protein
MARHEAASERWRTGIALRLYALALVPILFVLLGAGLQIQRAHREAQQAALVGSSIPEIAARQSLLVALMQEAVATQIATRAAVMTEELRAMLRRIGSLQSVPRAKASVDLALAALRVQDPELATRYRTHIDAARQFAGQPSTTAEVGSARYEQLQSQVLTDLIDSDVDLISKIAGLSAYSGLSSALETINVLGTTLYNREVQFDTLAQLILGSAHPRSELIATLGRTSGLYDQASRQLLVNNNPQVSASWSELINGPDTKLMDGLFNQLMTRETVDSATLIKSSAVEGKASAAVVVTTLNIASQGQAQLSALSTSVQESANNTLRTTLLAALLTLAVTFLFALRVTRSIRTPLSDLERGARAANSGETDITAIRSRGPRETRTVISSFNDLLANLRLVEAKTQALAELDLTNPALDAQLPGRMGAALDASMRALSESVAERTKLSEQLAHDAEHDALTGLANRQLALNWLGTTLQAHRQTGGRLAVLFIDLDGFKLVNDTHGHRIGDQLLVRVADVISAVSAGEGMVARLGGDEFLVLAEGLTIESAHALGKRLVDALSRRMELRTLSVSIGASVGVALCGDGSGQPADLVAAADLALYRAKQEGRGRVHVFDESMQHQAGELAEREEALRAMLARGGDELHLHFQSIVNGAGQVEAVEALVRWARPDHGLLLPDEFVRDAEVSDIVIDLDCWVLLAALRQAAAWQQDPHRSGLIVSVTVSGRHLLSGQLVDHVEQALRSTGVSARSLIIEIDGAVLAGDPDLATRELALLRAVGIRVALNHFGVGSTSVSTLRGLPLDVLKLDRSLVRTALAPADRDLLGALSNLGHVLGLTVIAEGVQTSEQWEVVRANGADLAQGPLFTQPVPAAQFTAMLAADGSGPDWPRQPAANHPSVPTA